MNPPAPTTASVAEARTTTRLFFADLNLLLAPIPGADPSGPSLRYDALYDRLREARREEDASIPQGLWKRDLKKANWHEVIEVAVDACRRSKDLQVGAWLLEAWINQHGFAGARQGLALLHGFCDRFWDTLHPLPDGEDFGGRISTIEWVNERLAGGIERIRVTLPGDGVSRPWTWNERTEALRRENDQRRSSGAIDAAGVNLTSAAFAVSAASTPRDFYVDAVEDLGNAIESTVELGHLLDEHCGKESPSLVRLLDMMTQIRDWMETMAVLPDSDLPLMEGEPPLEDPVAEASTTVTTVKTGGRMEPAAKASAMPLTGDTAVTRAEAYRKLAEAAETLMRLEPHSPTPYLVRRAIAWGGMSLAELMRHFIASGYDLNSLYSMLGMEEEVSR